MTVYMNIAQILVSVFVILAILMQVRGGGLGGIFGAPDTTYRSRRGVERTLFRFTIALMVLFVLLSITSVRLT
ncbi:MAG: preprotein translocase subunit SecG [Dehalococcoidia bacterium]|nr:preprotein translocase subunit SecG [Dehalococcoidia bacterium]